LAASARIVGQAQVGIARAIERAVTVCGPSAEPIVAVTLQTQQSRCAIRGGFTRPTKRRRPRWNQRCGVRHGIGVRCRVPYQHRRQTCVYQSGVLSPNQLTRRFARARPQCTKHQRGNDDQ
jgi:hypothetical protein